MDKLPFGCGALDAMLDGGVEAGCMTLLYGESGTGKTTLCLLLARDMAKAGKKVIYIDTEGVSMDRLRQISGPDFETVVKNILFSAISSFDEQERMVDKAIKLAQSNVDVGMIIIDSISMHYRLTSREEDRGDRKSLAGQSTKLTNLAREKSMAVVATSQVYTDVDTGTFEALGGHALHHNAKMIVRVDKAGPGGRRRAVLMKARHLPEGLEADFRLTAQGIEC
ncbi:MAG: DNA repair and recombination protein RadB [Methanomassiliicoccus sp.]|nr:DNA repair and recombination protein RadB [Methanomassiliicoccus sp.]